jgi:hypothetical protein
LSLVKKLVYLVILLLCLEVVKRVLDKLGFGWSILVTVMLSSIQYLAVLYLLFYIAFARFFKQGKRKWGIIISFLVFISLAEGLFAWLLYHSTAIPPFMAKSFEYYYYAFELDLPKYHRTLSVYDPRLFYTLKPGISERFQTKEFSVLVNSNSAGLRDDDSSLQKPSVICFGDSYAMGWGVEQNETFAQQLEQLSGKKVLNAGISSYGTARQVTLLQQLDASALDHIVIQYCSNDYKENMAYVQNNYQHKASSKEVLDSVMHKPYYAGYYFPGKYFSVISKVFIQRQVNRVWPIFKMANMLPQHLNEREHARVFVDVLKHSVIDFQKHRVIVCATGDQPEFGKEFLEEIKRLAGQQILVLDLSSTLQESDWFTMDRHLKPSGHRKVAQKISEVIR